MHQSVQCRIHQTIFVAALLLSSLAALAFEGSAEAAIPGTNGKIVFTSSRDEGNWNIYKMNPDGSGITRLTDSSDSDYYASWSPDGTKIAFFRDGSTRGLFVMNADGTGITQLTSSVDRDPEWSPDGTKIAVSRLDEGVSKIFVISSDGSGATLLPGNSTRDYDPTWSPDGTKIAFVVKSGDNGVYIMNSDGTGAAKLADGEDPEWSPDGNKIAFASGGTIRVIDASVGGGQIPLTDSAYDSYPSWSPDGTKIIFQRAIPDAIQQWEVYIMNSDSSGLMKLSSDGPVDFFPDFGSQTQSQNSNLTLLSQDMNGHSISGYWTVLYDGNGSVLKTGFTPVTFTLNNTQQYRIGMGSYDNYDFDHWQDNVSTTSSRNISITSDTQLTAVYIAASMGLNPVSGSNNTFVVVTGTNFMSNSLIIIKYDDVAIGRTPETLMSNSDGSFSAAISVPPSADGLHSVSAADGTRTAASTFTVISSGIAYPMNHMSDTTFSFGSLTYEGRQVNAEYVKPTSQLVGDKIDSITLRLQRVGSPTGTAEIGVFNEDTSVRKLFSTLNATSLSTTYQDYEFKLGASDLYMIQSGDKIGIKFSGGNSDNGINLMIDRITTDDLFDGTNSQRIRYESSWLYYDTSEDLNLILKQTHG